MLQGKKVINKYGYIWQYSGDGIFERNDGPTNTKCMSSRGYEIYEEPKEKVKK